MPRVFFGDLHYDDVWLLERALLRDGNLRRLACLGPIAVPLAELGMERLWIDWHLYDSGYQLIDDPDQVVEKGQFAWDTGGPPLLRIRLLSNSYPSTIVGIGNVKQRPAMYFLAWGHQRGQAIPDLWYCAEALKAAGTRYALVMDEGGDVFQCYIPDQGAADKFREADEKLQTLDSWMPVPFEYDGKLVMKALDGRETPPLRRHSVRASISVWQENPRGGI